MFKLITGLVLAFALILPSLVSADTTKRPDETRIVSFDVQTKALGPFPLETCLVFEGTNKEDIFTHFDCFPVTTDEISSHPVSVPEGLGHVLVFAITRYIDSDGVLVVSDLSDTRGKALDVPSKPELLP